MVEEASYFRSMRRWLGLGSVEDAEETSAKPSPYASPALPLSVRIEDRLAAGRYVEAVTLAFTTTLDEALKAYELTPTEGHTYLEAIRLLEENGSPEVAGLLRRLYDLYRPLRYGPPVRVEIGERGSEVRELVKELSLLSATRALSPPQPPRSRED